MLLLPFLTEAQIPEAQIDPGFISMLNLAYQHCDSNGDSGLSWTEINTCVTLYGSFLGSYADQLPTEITFDDWDLDSDGVLMFDEVITYLSPTTTTSTTTTTTTTTTPTTTKPNCKDKSKKCKKLEKKCNKKKVQKKCKKTCNKCDNECKDSKNKKFCNKNKNKCDKKKVKKFCKKTCNKC